MEVLTFLNSAEQKSLFDPRNVPSIIKSILGKFALEAFRYPCSMTECIKSIYTKQIKVTNRTKTAYLMINLSGCLIYY